MFMDLRLTLEPGTRSSLAERPPGVGEVMVSIPVGGSDFSLSRARGTSSLFTFHYTELKIHHLYSLITVHICDTELSRSEFERI